MTGKIDLGRIYAPSDDVVVREIEGEIVIVPLTSGIGDLEDECFTFDEWGRAVWSKIDGSRPLATVVQELLDDYDAPDEASPEGRRRAPPGALRATDDRRERLSDVDRPSRPHPSLGDNYPVAGLMRAVLEKGRPFRFEARGTSMHPFIQDGDCGHRRASRPRRAEDGRRRRLRPSRDGRRPGPPGRQGRSRDVSLERR